MFASFLTGLLLLTTPGTLTLAPDAGLEAENSVQPRLTADAIALGPTERLIAFQERALISPTISEADDSSAVLSTRDRPPAIAAGARPSWDPAGVGAIQFDAPLFDFSARWQGSDNARLRLRLGQQHPLQIDLSDSRTRSEASLSWRALPFLTLQGRSRGNRADFGGTVTFGPDDRHSLWLTRHTDTQKTWGTTDARLKFGGTIPTQIDYSIPDEGDQRLRVRQDLGPFRWELRQQTARVQLKTSLTLDRTRGKSLVALNLEHDARNRPQQTQSLTAATLNSGWRHWQGAVGVGWNAEGQTGAIVSARVPLLRLPQSSLDFIGSYRGIASTGRRSDYRLELRSRLRF